MDMDMRYDFNVMAPAERIGIAIRVSAADEAVMHASLTGVRRDLTDRALLRMFLTIPAIPLKVSAAIYWEALRLWLKGLRLRGRPAAPEFGIRGRLRRFFPRTSAAVTANIKHGLFARRPYQRSRYEKSTRKLATEPIDQPIDVACLSIILRQCANVPSS